MAVSLRSILTLPGSDYSIDAAGLSNGDRYRVASLGREHLKNNAETIDLYWVLGSFQKEA